MCHFRVSSVHEWVEGPSLGWLFLPVPFDPLPAPIPGKQTAYLSLKKGLHEASEEMVFFLKHLFQI